MKQNIEVVDKKDVPQPGPSHVWTKEDAELLKKKLKPQKRLLGQFSK